MTRGLYKAVSSKAFWGTLTDGLVRRTTFKGMIKRAAMGPMLVLAGVVVVTHLISLHESSKEEAFRTSHRISQALSEKLLVSMTTGDRDENLRVLNLALKDSALMRIELTVDPVVPGESASILTADSPPTRGGPLLRAVSWVCSSCIEPLIHKSYTFDVNADDYPSVGENSDSKARRLGQMHITLDLSDIVSPRLNQFAIILTIVALLVIFAFLFEQTIRRQISEPLEGLIKSMGKMKELTSDPTQHDRLSMSELPTSDQHEIKGLIIAFQRLIENVYQSEDGMKAVLAAQSDKIRAATASLEISLAKEKEASEIKGNFINLMSHELRQPLYASKTAALNMTRDEALSHYPNLRRNIELILREIAKASSQIDNVLEYSRNLRDPKVPTNSHFDLYRKVEGAVLSISGMAYAKDLYIDLIVEDGMPNQVVSSQEAWTHIIDNYLGNAIKYTETGGIRVYLSQLDETSKDTIWIRFSVEDTGVGVPDSKMDYIFEPFSQVEDARTRQQNGFGLGLAIVSENIQAMKGRRGVERLPQGGMRFWADIPVKRSKALSGDQITGASKLSQVGAQFVVMDSRESFRDSICSRLSNFDTKCVPAENIDQLGDALNQLDGDNKILIVRRIASRDFKRSTNDMTLEQIKAKGFVTVVSLEPTLESDAVEGVKFRKEADFGFVESLEMHSLITKIYASLQNRSSTEHGMAQLLSMLKVTEGETLRDVSVLLVDDQQVNLDVMSQSLQGYGAVVETARGGERAITLAKEQKYDVILMDIMMPIVDGISATRAIRSESKNQATPIFALSAAGRDEKTKDEMEFLGMVYMNKMTADEALVFGIQAAISGGTAKPVLTVVP
ncbi:hybrid sensor histidine kinase/response regulator (plasmid) [Pseudomonas fluorescens]|uniref:hybrid sensor histidine kinase/response regulator n=1 Tax=Pseudomonas TaxID=286 RepID=UPI001F12D157|nr:MULTISPECIES: ATP-binding protein [Pseudomonas]